MILINSNKGLAYLGWIAVGLLFAYLCLIQVYYAWDFTVDDTFITLRYAKNWVQGYGLVWNAGASPVEGYSNFSFLLLAAFMIKMGINPVISLKIMGWFSLICSAYLLYCLSRLWFKPSLAIIPALWMLSYRGQILWSISGLETAFYQGLVLASAWYLLKGLGYRVVETGQTFRWNKSYLLVSGIILGLAGITRLDMAAIAIAWTCSLLLFFYINRKQLDWLDRMQILGYFITGIVFVFGTYFLWRWHYFGRFLPNSVYCKWLTGVSKGRLVYYYIILAAPFIALIIPYWFKFRDSRIAFLLVPSLLYCLFLYDSDSVMGLNNRLFLTCFSLILPLALAGIVVIVNGMSRWISQGERIILTYLIALYFTLLFIPLYSLSDYAHDGFYEKEANQQRLALSQWVSRYYGSNSALVLGDCGIVGYFSQFHIIDSYCLNSKQMTELPLDKARHKFVRWVMESLKPPVIVITRYIREGVVQYPLIDRVIVNNPEFKQSYRLAASFQIKPEIGDYRYQLYQRVDYTN